MAFFTLWPRARLVGIPLAGAALLSIVASCSSLQQEIPAAERPLSKEAQELLAKKGMKAEDPIFVRIFKEESELEIWKRKDDGRFYHFKTYPVCNWSGGLGPKLKQGDKQAPEGFYTITPGQMNPRSQYHLAFNLGFPNAYDRAHGRDGQFLMVHGDCRSAGCYAMTDALVEEIYALARDAFKGGQDKFNVHAFPFRMTAENMKRYSRHKWMPFWRTLKEGYDHFELSRQPPQVAVCDRRYVVGVRFTSDEIVRPDAACPPFERVRPTVFVEALQSKMPEKHVMAVGPKKRNLLAEGVAEDDASQGVSRQSITSLFTFGRTTTSSTRTGRDITKSLGFNQ
jgi:murein L,D-transpeptidase YafK